MPLYIGHNSVVLEKPIDKNQSQSISQEGFGLVESSNQLNENPNTLQSESFEKKLIEISKSIDSLPEQNVNVLDTLNQNLKRKIDPEIYEKMIHPTIDVGKLNVSTGSTGPSKAKKPKIEKPASFKFNVIKKN